MSTSHRCSLLYILLNMKENIQQDKIIQTEVLLQALSLKLAGIRHEEGNESKVEELVQLRRDVYSGKVKDPLSEISKLH